MWMTKVIWVFARWRCQVVQFAVPRFIYTFNVFLIWTLTGNESSEIKPVIYIFKQNHILNKQIFFTKEWRNIMQKCRFSVHLNGCCPLLTDEVEEGFWGLPHILSLFRNKFHKFNKTGARMLDSIYHMTEIYCEITFLAWKCLDFAITDVNTKSFIDFNAWRYFTPRLDCHMSQDVRFPIMWYVRPAKAQTSAQSDQNLC